MISPLLLARLRGVLEATPDARYARIHKDDLATIIGEFENQRYTYDRNAEIAGALRVIGEAMRRTDES